MTRTITRRTVLAAAATAAVLPPGRARAAIEPFPKGFRIQEVPVNGTTLHVRVGGQGPAALLLHGFADTGDMWAPLAARLSAKRTLVVPDLRGMGLSARPPGGYDKKTQGRDMAALLDALKIERADLVTHDIGNMVGYALAAQFQPRIAKFVIMDAPLRASARGTTSRADARWHFSFWGPDAERLVAARSIYLDRFWNEFAADRSRSTRRRASTMPSSTPSPARSMPAWSSSRPSTRTPATTRPCWPRAAS